MNTDQLLIRRFRKHELNLAISDAVKRGYEMIDRGMHRNEFVQNSKILYWAKLRKKHDHQNLS